MSVIEDNWNYSIDLHSFDRKSYCEFETTVFSFKENILQQLDDGFKIQKFVYSGKVVQNHDDELKDLVEKNRILRNQIESKMEDLSQQQQHYETCKKDQKLISQEIKETHEAFLMAKKYYKKYLKMYHTIESRKAETQTVFLQFFTEAKRDSENYSVRLLRNTKLGRYQLISSTPKLSNLKDLQRKLQETNDVPGALCSIRQAFLSVKSNKKEYC